MYATATDWIGLYTAGSTGSWWAWVYVSCTTSAGSAAASGTCPIGVPFSVPNGSYELRLFANSGTRLATSNQFTVGPSSLPVFAFMISRPIEEVFRNDNGTWRTGPREYDMIAFFSLKGESGQFKNAFQGLPVGRC